MRIKFLHNLTKKNMKGLFMKTKDKKEKKKIADTNIRVKSLIESRLK